MGTIAYLPVQARMIPFIKDDFVNISIPLQSSSKIHIRDFPSGRPGSADFLHLLLDSGQIAFEQGVHPLVKVCKQLEGDLVFTPVGPCCSRSRPEAPARSVDPIKERRPGWLETARNAFVTQ